MAVFDPIDGSKNIDASLPVGTIFGIYKSMPGTKADDSTFLQKVKNSYKYIRMLICKNDNM